MSFDNLENNNIKKVNLFLAAVMTFAAIVISVFLPALSFLSLAVMPVWITFLIISDRIKDGLIGLVLGVMVLFIFNYILAIVFLSLILGVSFIYRYCISNDKKIGYFIGLIFLVFCTAGALYILLVLVIGKINIISEYMISYNAYIDNIVNDPLLAGYKDLLSISDAELDSFLNRTTSVLRNVPYVMPGVLAVIGGLTSYLNYYFSYLIFKKYGFNLRKIPEFSKWDISWHFCWGFILGLVMVLIPSGSETAGLILDAIGINLLIVFTSIYIVLGVSVIWSFLGRTKIQKIWKVLIIVIACLFLIFLILIFLIGLSDIWFNFRKLKRR